MTKKKKFLTLGLIGVCLVGLFGGAACKPTGENSSLDSAPSVQETLICGFDSYKELTSLRWVNSFGAVELSTEYKTQGDNAAMLTVRGHHESTFKPQVIIPTDTDYVTRTDYTDVESVLLDVYNANATEQKIGFQYLTKTENSKILSAEIIETIPAKTQETIEFKIDRNVTAQFLNLDLVASLRLTFENQKTYHDPNRIFYVDNMRIKTTDVPIDTSVKVRKDGEYESCDRPEYLSVWGNILPYVYSKSDLSFNDNSTYIKGGEGSFKLTSHYSGGSATAVQTVGFNIQKSLHQDISKYYSISFWVYNANDVPIKFFINEMFVRSLPAQDWVQIEITTDWLQSQGLDITNFGPKFQFHTYSDKQYTWYIDEICLNTVAVNLLPPTLNVTDEQANKTLALAWENKGAASYSYKVLVDGQEKVAETDIGLNTSVSVPYGEYVNATMMEVFVTAYGNGEDKQTTSYKKAFFDFTFVPENFTMKKGETKALPLAETEVGELSWKVEDIRAITTGYDSFQVVSTLENPTEITFNCDSERLLKITWVLTVGEYSIERYTFVLPEMETCVLLTEEYEDFFAEIEGKYTGDIKQSDYELLDGQSTIRVYNGTGLVKGSFSNNVYLGEHLSYFDYFLYNASDAPVRVQITSSDNVFTIPAHSMIKMNFSYWVNVGIAGWKDWKIVKDNGTLNDMNITATSQANAPVDLYIGCFRVNSNAFDYGPIYLSGDTADDKATITWGAVSNTKNYSYQVKINGNEVIAATNIDKERKIIFDYSSYLADMVELEIVVTATSNDNESITATWTKTFLSFTSLPESEFIAVGTNHPVPTATADKGTITWKAEYVDARFSRGNWTEYVGNYVFSTVESPTHVNLVDEYRMARITWTLTSGDYSINEYTYYIPAGNCTVLDEYYLDYLSSGTTSGDLNTTDKELINGTRWLHLNSETSRASGKYTFAESIFLGDGRKNFEFFIYNASDEVVTVKMYDGNINRKIGPKTMMYVNLLAVANWELCVEGWGIVSKDGNLNNFSITATTEQGAVDVYVGGFRINKTAFELGSFTLNGNSAHGVVTASWDAVTNATKYAYRVIVDGVETVELTDVGNATQTMFDYSELTVNDYVEIVVIAYNSLGVSKTASYRYSCYSGTY